MNTHTGDINVYAPLTMNNKYKQTRWRFRKWWRREERLLRGEAAVKMSAQERGGRNCHHIKELSGEKIWQNLSLSPVCMQMHTHTHTKVSIINTKHAGREGGVWPSLHWEDAHLSDCTQTWTHTHLPVCHTTTSLLLQRIICLLVCNSWLLSAVLLFHDRRRAGSRSHAQMLWNYVTFAVKLRHYEDEAALNVT